MIRHRGTGYPCQRAQAVPSVGVAKEKFCERHTHFFSQPSFSRTSIAVGPLAHGAASTLEEFPCADGDLDTRGGLPC